MAEQKEPQHANDTDSDSMEAPPSVERQHSNDYQQIFNEDAEDDPTDFNTFIKTLEISKPQATAEKQHKKGNYNKNTNYNDQNINDNNNNIDNNNNNPYTNDNNNAPNNYQKNSHHKPHNAKISYKWQWDAGAYWKDYKMEDSQAIELQYGSSDLMYIDIKNSLYQINLVQLHQVNTKNGKKRKLKRVPIDHTDNSKHGGHGGGSYKHNNNNKKNYGQYGNKYNNNHGGHSNNNSQQPPKYNKNMGNNYGGGGYNKYNNNNSKQPPKYNKNAHCNNSNNSGNYGGHKGDNYSGSPPKYSNNNGGNYGVDNDEKNKYGNGAGHVWQCLLGGSWKDYDAPISQFIESKYAQNMKIFECKIRNSKYYINLEEMTQSNAWTAKKRQIRRSQMQINPNQNHNNYTSEDKPHFIKNKVYNNNSQNMNDNNSQNMNDKIDNPQQQRYGPPIFAVDSNQNNASPQSQRSYASNSPNIKVTAPNMPQYDDNDDDSKSNFSLNNDNSSISISPNNSNKNVPIYNSNKANLVGEPNKWQWKDANNNWADYEDTASKQMEILYQNNGKIFKYKAPHNGQVYTIKFNDLQQYNEKTNVSRDIRRVPLSMKSNASPQVHALPVIKSNEKAMKWQWFDEKHFIDYDKKDSIAMEKAYKCTKKSYKFKNAKSKSEYIVIFNTMKQKNTETNNERDIRRVPLSVKGGKQQKIVRQRSKYGWPDPKTWKGPKSSAKRKVFGDKIMTLYHITDASAGDAIFKQHKMIRGGSGMFGGGIYFAETLGSAKHKAEHHGVLITAKVFVGKEHVVNDSMAGHFSFQELQKLGCDSVYAPYGSGSGAPERVVYNFDQVCVITKKAI